MRSALNNFENFKQKCNGFAQDSIHFPAEGFDFDKLKDMSAEEKNALAVDLSIQALSVQKVLSREMSYVNWLKAKIDKEIAPKILEIGGYLNADQKRSVAISMDTYTTELENLRVNTQAKVDMLTSIPYQINQIIKTLESLSVAHGKTNYSRTT